MIYLHELIRVRLKRRKVAIGLYRFDETSEERVLRAAEIAGEFADVAVVDEGEKTEEVLYRLVRDGEVHAVVRGTARASKFLQIIRKEYSPKRVAVLETADKRLFLLAPVGVDEGKTVKEKLELIEHARSVAERLGLEARVAVLAGGRYGDVGRSREVDESLAMAELTARLSGGENFEIRLEDAVSSGIVIAPDGISGNLIFRSLCYLGAGREYGAVYCGLPFRIVDTSRSQSAEGFARAIALATVI
ncbi:putative phosphotransacetylase [Geoglobus ahangari]|uniref:Putative phosphotransacetylase n=1 Tax=Geoglobus ahangari TaxID=113653 RepID=A0A0F7IGU8_9EURY|nr:hypothetical protein [Geoglobus ahangari]AKG91182.1 putative phosphotransacetylase [Geoglobus ahangari]